MNAGRHERTDQRDIETGEAALHWAASAGTAVRVAALARAQARRRDRRRTFALASAGALLILVAARFAWGPSIVPAAANSPSSAIVAAPPTQLLPDGSLVALRDEARIASAFTIETRAVVLERGEAHFQVAHQAERPFVVTTRGVRVRAIGTAFSVRTSDDGVEILVNEGRVAVEREGDHPAAPRVELAAGTRIEMPALATAEPPRPLPVSAAEMSGRLAWRVPRIDLSATPLAEALPLFNRYSRVRLTLEDPALGSLQLSGMLRPDTPDSLLRVLKNDFGIEAVPAGENHLLLRRH